MTRRRFMAGAASLGVMGVWATRSTATPSRLVWREDRASFPQGVASGDPDEHSVVLWLGIMGSEPRPTIAPPSAA